jgi:hypothetical protein
VLLLQLWEAGWQVPRKEGDRQAGISHISHQRGVLPHLEPLRVFFLKVVWRFDLGAGQLAAGQHGEEDYLLLPPWQGKTAFIVREGVGHGGKIGKGEDSL